MNSLDSLVTFFEEAFHEEIMKIGLSVPEKLYEPIAYSLKIGGKRLRPALMLHAASMFTKSVGHVLPAAMAIEIFHNFTLLHDDIMDKAVVRHNVPTVHKKYNTDTAILSGDAMSIMAFRYFVKDNNDRLHSMLPLFSSTALQVCEGQQYDMNYETRNNVSVKEYLEMIRLKTAVLIACSLKIGALLADAGQSDADLLYEYGINIGLAFQLQDDWLDVYGDPEVFGKMKGGDICANKKTYLLLKTIEICDPPTLQQLNSWLLKSDFDPDKKIAAITAIYNKTGVCNDTRALMQDYINKALTALKSVNVPADQKNALIAFAGEVTRRIR